MESGVEDETKRGHHGVLISGGRGKLYNVV
jgi:hypothetical protein